MQSSQPRLSVIVCSFNMARALPRTILSATAPYQRDVSPDAYEVIVVDNGSTVRPSRSYGTMPPNVRLVDVPDARPSPVFAMNWAAHEIARGDILLFAIDGARIFSDRLYAESLRAHDLLGPAFVFTLAFHLGPKVQMISTQEGYDEAVEDALIADSGWPARPGGLYEISVFAGSSAAGYFKPISESNSFSIRRTDFERLGGYDERFTSPGGGLCNLEMFERYVTDPATLNVCVLSEGTFHQVHGGVATNQPNGWPRFSTEYQEIMGRGYRPPAYDPVYVGSVRPEAAHFVRESLDRF